MTFSVGGTTVITSDRIVQLTTGATASRPTEGSRVPGQLFFDTTLNKLIVWDGAAWRESISSTVATPSAWSWGQIVSSSGTIGDGTVIPRSSPVSIVGGFTDWVQISASANFSIGLRANGTAWSWGTNSYGALGINLSGAGTSRSSPVSVVGGFTDWVFVSNSFLGHTIGIRANGQAWAWGYNGRGQLGINYTNDRSSPTSVVGGFTDWKQVAGGRFHSVGVRANGTAWTWGFNQFGQLGNNTFYNTSSPVSVLGGFSDWTQVSAGWFHTLGVRSNGLAWSWGRNNSGQLADYTTVYRSSPVSLIGGITDWVQVAAGGYHSLGLRANGTARSWGNNSEGRLGDGTMTNRSNTVAVAGGFTNWVQLTAGFTTSMGIRSNGTAWAWGSNPYGRLGIGDTNYRVSPTSIVGGFTDWVQISAGNSHAAGLRTQPGRNRTG